MLRKLHLSLIARHSIRHGIRGGAGLVALFTTLVLGLGLSECVLRPVEEARQLDSRMFDHVDEGQKDMIRLQAKGAVIKAGRKAIDWAVDPSPDQLDYLTTDKPVIVSAILVLLLLVTPFLSCLAGFNQTAGDISTKGLRFLLIRTERPNIFFGRFIGTYFFSVAVYALLFTVLTLYCALRVDVHPAGDMALWFIQGFFRLAIFSLPYIALCALVSCAIDSSFGALVISLLLAYIVPLLVTIGSAATPAIRYGQYLTPWGFKYWLFQPVASAQLWGGIGAMCAFTAGVLWLGNRYFSKRDL